MSGNEEQKETSASEPISNAFANPTTLSSFSLPPNLNGKLVTNKQKLQEQQENSGHRLNTNARPKLANLTSNWSTQRNIVDVISEENLIDIKLPPLTVHKIKATTIWQEIKLIGTIAVAMCLFSSAYLTFQTDLPYIYSLFFPGWLFALFWFTLGRSDIIYSLKHFRNSAIIMLLVTSWSYKSILLPQLLACTLFYVTERISNAYHQLELEIVQQLELQQSNAQNTIDRIIEEYMNRRTLFLSTVSQEIKDAAVMVMATLEQFSPSSILMNTHELLSACSMAVPIASISAINTTIKEACHIGSHLSLISKMLRQSTSHHVLPEEERVKSTVRQEFDMGELIQNVGDALAGMSAKLGVHFVIYHTDNLLYYPNVIGDEEATKHALTNLLRNMLEGCTPGACIELGLSSISIPNSPKIKVTFEIIQTASPAIPVGLSNAVIPNANFTGELLNYVGGEMSFEDLGKNKTRVEVSFELYPGSNSDQKLLFIEKPSQILEKQLQNIRFSNEPTLDDLTTFVTQLKGVRLVLHAPEKSVFAKHLTSCLTSWNTDISHLPVLTYTEEEEGNTASDTGTTAGSDTDSVNSQQLRTPMEIHSQISTGSNRTINSTPSSKKVPSPAIEEDHIHSIPPAFILIDDDILTLEKKLREFRDKSSIPSMVLQQQQQQQQQQQRKHRRSRSRTGAADAAILHGTVAVIFFSSLSNYKRVRDTIQWFSSIQQPPYLPRVVVVPKPAGPRRFLTALHTAWNNAIVEPQFLPIATSPFSPFVGNYFSPSLSMDSNSLSSALATPGGMLGGGAPMMTPHENAARFSPGRRQTNTGPPGRMGVLSSPSGLQLEPEKGNYFFDPSRSGSTGGNMPAKLNTSPHLTAVGGPVVSSPIIMKPTTNSSTPGSNNSTSASSNNSHASNASSDIKRRLRSQSQSYMNPTRRTLVDISLTSPSSDQLVTETHQEQEQLTGRMASIVENDSSTSTPTPGESPPEVKPVPPTPAPVVSPPTKEITQTDQQPPVKPKAKLNFKISNRKRKEKTNTSSKPSPPITVLIVEDNMINQAILSTWMKKHNIKFSVASDGKEAVEKWKGGGFHLILMDIQLPVMDGIEATKTIRAVEKERQIGVLPSNVEGSSDEQRKEKEMKNSPSPSTSSSSSANVSTFQSPVIIVALTASSLESDRQAALAAGCNDFLTKPVSLEWLEKKIMEWGCMQALIDFEGWRKWKRTADGTSKKEKPKALNNGVSEETTKEMNEAKAREREALELRTKAMLKNESRSIVLVGINKRRTSMAVFDDRSIPNSGSNTPVASGSQTIPKSASPTRTTFHHSSRLRKRASDPDLHNLELSIPEQVAAREKRLLLEEQRLLESETSSSSSEEENSL